MTECARLYFFVSRLMNEYNSSNDKNKRSSILEMTLSLLTTSCLTTCHNYCNNGQSGLLADYVIVQFNFSKAMESKEITRIIVSLAQKQTR